MVQYLNVKVQAASERAGPGVDLDWGRLIDNSLIP
jgi:hypothetical protein